MAGVQNTSTNRQIVNASNHFYILDNFIIIHILSKTPETVWCDGVFLYPEVPPTWAACLFSLS